MEKEYYCSACGRKHSGKHSSKYCRKHQWQLYKFGEVLDSNPRTKYDPNEFRFIEGHVEFDTYSYPSQEVCKTYIIDAEDYPLVSKYKWYTTSGGYAMNKTNKMFLHKLIMGSKRGQEIDHMNLNPLDNRKENLRYCTGNLNKMNRNPYNTLGVKGVQKHRDGKYSAYLTVNSKMYHSPCYKTIEEAAFARFILEQIFIKDFLAQHSLGLISRLSEKQKEYIIFRLKEKFNIKS